MLKNMNTNTNSNTNANTITQHFILYSIIVILLSGGFFSTPVLGNTNPYHYKNNSGMTAKKQKKRTKLKAIFKETKRIAIQSSHGLNPGLTQKMKLGTRAYHTRRNGNLLSLHNKREYTAPSSTPRGRHIKTVYRVISSDSFSAARQLVNQGYHPLVLNMANKNAIGGGVEGGASAQEESLFRASNYFMALYHLGKSKPNRDRERKYYHYPIQEFGSYYTPHVQVFRDANHDYAFITPFTVSCIAVAGYDLAKPYSLEKRLLSGTGKGSRNGPRNRAGNGLGNGPAINLAAFKKYTKLKIRHILEVAMLHHHDSLVLGAISCGAFRLKNDNSGITANIVAEAYQEVLEEPRYKNRFRNITFAILSKGKIGNINYQVFNNMVARIS